MPRPQSPEVHRSGNTPALEPDNIGSRLEARKRPKSSGGGGPVPAENRPGHHPEHEQDRRDPDEFVQRAAERADSGDGPGVNVSSAVRSAAPALLGQVSQLVERTGNGLLGLAEWLRALSAEDDAELSEEEGDIGG